jgi:hypothetical protein
MDLVDRDLQRANVVAGDVVDAVFERLFSGSVLCRRVRHTVVLVLA